MFVKSQTKSCTIMYGECVLMEEDEKITRARLLLKKFQTKHSRRGSNESEAVLDEHLNFDSRSLTGSNGSPTLKKDVDEPQSSEQQHVSSQTIHELELRVNGLVAERDHLAAAVANQSTQIEYHRRECSSLEAKLVLMQQDRIDAQSRIKSLYTTKSQLEQLVEQQKSDLALRDIYIRQLTRQSGTVGGCEQSDNDGLGCHTDGSANSQPNDIQRRFDDELEWHKNKMIELQNHLQLVQEQHQTESAQTNANVKKLIEELESMRARNAQLETCNTMLEERLKLMSQNPLDDTGAVVTPINNNEQNPITPVPCDDDSAHRRGTKLDVTLMDTVQQLTRENENFSKKLYEYEQLIQQKDHSFDQLQQSMGEAQSRIAYLEQCQNIQSTLNTDASLLSVQLQNEKATVSRAVAQNVELKSQLKELQDRLIVVINECAVKEDQRLTAQATVERLTQQLNDSNKQKNEYDRTEKDDNSATPLPQSVQVEECRRMADNDQWKEEHHHHPSPNVQTATVSTTTETICSSNLCDVGLQTDDANVTEDQHEENKRTNNDFLSARKQHIDDKCDEEKQTAAEGDEPSIDLTKQMEALCRENALYKSNNERLEYWLTALESENESIGEYIALYRFQRAQIQQRMVEKDAALQQFHQQNAQLTATLCELRNAVLAVMQKNVQNCDGGTATGRLTTDSSCENSMDQEADESACAHSVGNVQKQGYHPPPTDDESGGGDKPTDRLTRILERSEAVSRQATCMAINQAQMAYTGCVECQGEVFNL